LFLPFRRSSAENSSAPKTEQGINRWVNVSSPSLPSSAMIIQQEEMNMKLQPQNMNKRLEVKTLSASVLHTDWITRTICIIYAEWGFYYFYPKMSLFRNDNCVFLT
jgi:hypothetical protein